MSILWTSADVGSAMGTSIAPQWLATGISIDSRTIKPGDLFVALAGPNNNGNDYAMAALQQGAVAAIVSRPVSADPRLIVVPDTLEALRQLAAAARVRSQARIIAVTGSVGKTGTKEALRHLLSEQGETFASAASFNNHWGLPLSLALLPPTAKYAVFEMGMNHPGEIEPLSRLARPHVALVTNVEAVHLGPMGSLEAIAQAKAEIFAGLEPSSTAIINTASNGVEILKQHAPQHVLTFNASSDADATLVSLDLTPAGSIVTAQILNGTYSYFVPLPGAHHAANSLGVMLAIAALGGDLERAAVHYSTLAAISGRGITADVVMPFGMITLIDESYNASPVAVHAALKVLGMRPRRDGTRRIVVLGDMRELGDESPRFHRELAPGLLAAGIDQAYLCGENMKHLHDALPNHLRGAHTPDSSSLLPHLLRGLRDGDVVLVKGSLGSNMKVIMQALRAGTGDFARAL